MAKKRAAKKAKKPHPLKKASRLWLPYPVFIFVMLCVGVLLYMWTFRADAIDYTVKAKVPAPPLTEPSVITSPNDGQRFSSVPIIVVGTCPLDSYINLYRNNVYSGSALCTSDGKFELQTDLFEGANELLPRVYNLTDDEGPAGTAVTVYYDKPVPPPAAPSTETPSSPTQPDQPPLTIKSDFKLIGYFVGQEVKLRLEIAGGWEPYAMTIDWGDGTVDLLSHKDAGRITLKHIYQKAGGEKGNYKIKINLTDSKGNKAFLQMFSIVNAKDVPLPNITTAASSPPGSYLNSGLLKFLWPAYAVVVLMALSFWLGEREELIELRRQSMRRRRA